MNSGRFALALRACEGRFMTNAAGTIAIYVDADACPVKPEIYRVAERHRLKVFVVANSFMMVPREPWLVMVLVFLLSALERLSS